MDKQEKDYKGQYCNRGQALYIVLVPNFLRGGKMINSKQKGKRGERYVVNKFKENGYECNRTAQFKGNTGRADDIEGIDYIHCEVKFVEKLNITNAMQQAIRDSNASDRQAYPTVFHKKNNEELLVTMRFDDWLQLYNEYYSGEKLKEAGICNVQEK